MNSVLREYLEARHIYAANSAPGALPQISHPPHYGGEANPYEAIKVIEAWNLGFNLGNTVKYLARAGKKGPALVDLQKARWYLDREIESRVVSGKKEKI